MLKGYSSDTSWIDEAYDLIEMESKMKKMDEALWIAEQKASLPTAERIDEAQKSLEEIVHSLRDT